MKNAYGAIGILVCILLLGGGFFVWKNFRGAIPLAREPSEKIEDLIGNSGNNSSGEARTDFPLRIARGFSISIFARDLPGARAMALDSFGNMWVSQTSEGIISLLEVENGKVVRQNSVLKNLARPHGLAFDPKSPNMLYFAQESEISRILIYSEGGPEKIIDLPAGGRHFTRTIQFGPDGRIYVSIGSSCDVCNETDDRRAKIFSLNRDGSDFKEFARGLRNAVFFTWSYVDGRMWATEMGRDLLGDNAPPDEINIIEKGKNYGWPICYGKNIHDTAFDKNTYIRNPCMEPFEAPSYIDIPAHSAPLGLAFIPKEGWPEEYWYDLLVAYHGSWNRSEPTGYKIVRVKLDEKGNFEGFEDFITGWLMDSGEVLGRPVGILVRPGGVLYISDDRAGVIYKVEYRPDASSAPSQSEKACIQTGCSGQICSDEEIISTCEYRQEYACYKDAVCERGQNGKCGWRDTKALSMCIENAMEGVKVQ